MKEIKHVIFDLGNVLVNIDLKTLYYGFDKILDRSENEVILFKEKILPLYETGKISTNEFLSSFEPYLKKGYSTTDLIPIWNSVIHDFPAERLLFVRNLKKHFTISILSNINDLHANYFDSKFMDWFGVKFQNEFDNIFYSHEIALRKPTRECYEFVINNIHSKPNEVVFVDDLIENVNAAKEIGINAKHLSIEEDDIIKLFHREFNIYF